MPLPFYGSSITRLRPTVANDAYNNRATSWDDPDEATFLAHAQPTGSRENRGAKDRTQVVSTYTFWLDSGADVASGDRLLWSGLVLDVDGEPQRFFGPLGGSHVEVRAVVSKG